jgi:signal-transduction protein with cAMP-binding, CBS, and nucleotidyltransferase domain
LERFSVPETLRTKLSEVNAFRWAIKVKYGTLEMMEMHEYLPENMVERLMFDSYQSMLNKVPFFSIIPDKILQNIISRLQSAIYIPGDYVMMKGEIGSEMYFIIEGGLDVINPNSGDLDYRIGNNGFIGELGVLTEVRRYSSAIAHMYSLISILTKEDFEYALSTNKEVMDLMRER